MDSHSLIHRFAAAASAARADDSLLPAGWSAADWTSLAALAQPIGIEAGDALITSGNTEQSLFLVCSGSVEVAYVARQTLTMSIMSHVPAGSIVGEQSFFDASPRSANVWAVEDCALLRIDLRDFERYALAEPRRAFELSFALGRVLALRLRATTARIGV
ncbi:Crp/Fnr family transcriptional regulator [Derxia lacustris]|uniref:Crp/Fnr family transcriptional regulator n=1 Tax=Derxia lacustris TaxID=764842 RepID=UPI000A17760F|nr:cyclic nucleotide-binding domain-containing protein [Derxia lacustris]